MKYNKDKAREKLPLFKHLPPWKLAMGKDGDAVAFDAEDVAVPSDLLADYVLAGFHIEGFNEWFQLYIEDTVSNDQQEVMSGRTVRTSFPLWLSRHFGKGDNLNNARALLSRRFPDLEFAMMGSGLSLRLRG